MVSLSPSLRALEARLRHAADINDVRLARSPGTERGRDHADSSPLLSQALGQKAQRHIHVNSSVATARQPQRKTPPAIQRETLGEQAVHDFNVDLLETVDAINHTIEGLQKNLSAWADSMVSPRLRPERRPCYTLQKIPFLQAALPTRRRSPAQHQLLTPRGALLPTDPPVYKVYLPVEPLLTPRTPSRASPSPSERHSPRCWVFPHSVTDLPDGVHNCPTWAPGRRLRAVWVAWLFIVRSQTLARVSATHCVPLRTIRLRVAFSRWRRCLKWLRSEKTAGKAQLLRATLAVRLLKHFFQVWRVVAGRPKRTSSDHRTSPQGPFILSSPCVTEHGASDSVWFRGLSQFKEDPTSELTTETLQPSSQPEGHIVSSPSVAELVASASAWSGGFQQRTGEPSLEASLIEDSSIAQESPGREPSSVFHHEELRVTESRECLTDHTFRAWCGAHEARFIDRHSEGATRHRKVRVQRTPDQQRSKRIEAVGRLIVASLVHLLHLTLGSWRKLILATTGGRATRTRAVQLKQESVPHCISTVDAEGALCDVICAWRATARRSQFEGLCPRAGDPCGTSTQFGPDNDHKQWVGRETSFARLVRGTCDSFGSEAHSLPEQGGGVNVDELTRWSRISDKMGDAEVPCTTNSSRSSSTFTFLSDGTGSDSPDSRTDSKVLDLYVSPRLAEGTSLELSELQASKFCQERPACRSRDSSAVVGIAAVAEATPSTGDARVLQSDKHQSRSDQLTAVHDRSSSSATESVNLEDTNTDVEEVETPVMSVSRGASSADGSAVESPTTKTAEDVGSRFLGHGQRGLKQGTLGIFSSRRPSCMLDRRFHANRRHEFGYVLLCWWDAVFRSRRVSRGVWLVQRRGAAMLVRSKMSQSARLVLASWRSYARRGGARAVEGF